MTWIVVFLGACVVGAGGYGLVRPEGLIGVVKAAWKTPAALPFAVGLRVALGIALLVAAPECRYPLAMQVIGVISLLAAAAGLVMGRARLDAFVDWWARRPPGFVRAWAVVAIAFGGFLVFAAI